MALKDGVDHQELEFGRGFSYKKPLSINMLNVGNALLEQLVSFFHYFFELLKIRKIYCEYRKIFLNIKRIYCNFSFFFHTGVSGIKRVLQCDMYV